MGEGVCHQCFAWMLIAVGAILVLVTVYTTWNIWIVIGALFIIKGILKLAKPMCPHCEVKPTGKKK